MVTRGKQRVYRGKRLDFGDNPDHVTSRVRVTVTWTDVDATFCGIKVTRL